MDGLTQSYIFKKKLQNCEPIDNVLVIAPKLQLFIVHIFTNAARHIC
jgi:hypothetical protein